MNRDKVTQEILLRAFSQPAGQPVPREFLALLLELDRTKRR